MDERWHEEIAVLEHGLPPLPQDVGDDEDVAVARWVGPRFGAVLCVRWAEGDDEDPEFGPYLGSEIYTFRRTSGGWESTMGGGGGGWFDPPLVRPNLPSDAAGLDHFHAGDGYASAFGRTGVDAATVEVEEAGGITRHSIESPLGVFIVIAGRDERATVRVRTEDGRILFEQDFAPESVRP